MLSTDDMLIALSTGWRPADVEALPLGSFPVTRGWTMSLEASPQNRLGERFGIAQQLAATPTAVIGIEFSPETERAQIVRLVHEIKERFLHCWVVERNVVLDSDDPENGHVYRFGLTRRRSGISREDYRDRWLHGHAPLVLRRHPLFDRYAINLVDDDEDSTWDGIVEQRVTDFATWSEHDRRVVEEKLDVLDDLDRFKGDSLYFAGLSRREIYTRSIVSSGG